MTTTAPPEAQDLLADQAAEPATKIVEYNETAMQLAALRQRMQAVVYDVSTPKGLDAAKKDRRELVTLRTALDAKRKVIKADVLERGRLIDAEAKRIEAEIVELETPIDQQIKAEEARREAEKLAKIEAERKRVATIHTKIDEYRRAVSDATGLKSTEIALIRNELAATRFDEVWPAQFAEFADEAKAARDSAVIGLADLQDRVARQEAEAAQIEADRKELAELKRLQEEQREREERARAAAEAKAKAEREAADRAAAEERARAEAKARAEREEADRVAAVARAEEEKRLQAAQAALAAERAEFERQQRVAREAEEARERAAREKAEALAQEERDRQHAEAHHAAMCAAMTEPAAKRPREEVTVENVLIRAEAFIAGFEDDDTQAGVKELLADLRELIAVYAGDEVAA
jgi:colicin import membrane protein